MTEPPPADLTTGAGALAGAGVLLAGAGLLLTVVATPPVVVVVAAPCAAADCAVVSCAPAPGVAVVGVLIASIPFKAEVVRLLTVEVVIVVGVATAGEPGVLN